MNDLISRQAAIDALRYAQHRFTVADEAGGMGTVKATRQKVRNKV